MTPTTTINLPTLATVNEMAAILQVTNQTIRIMAQRQEIPGYKVGGRWRFDPCEVMASIVAKGA